MPQLSMLQLSIKVAGGIADCVGETNWSKWERKSAVGWQITSDSKSKLHWKASLSAVGFKVPFTIRRIFTIRVWKNDLPTYMPNSAVLTPGTIERNKQRKSVLISRKCEYQSLSSIFGENCGNWQLPDKTAGRYPPRAPKISPICTFSLFWWSWRTVSPAFICTHWCDFQCWLVR